jgi:hypothetical protein
MMNKNQRLIAILAAAVFLIINLFPPWLANFHDKEPLLRWGLLFSPPGFAGARIHWVILFFEWVVLFIASGFLVWAFREPRNQKSE